MMGTNAVADGCGWHSSEPSSERPYRFKTSGMILPMDFTPTGKGGRELSPGNLVMICLATLIARLA
jgi:hypothetical protein